jgi:hypothetical protein
MALWRSEYMTSEDIGVLRALVAMQHECAGHTRRE